MPDLFEIGRKWWKHILGLVILSLVVAGVFLFTTPNQYLAVSTALPASSFGADKSKIFNENIEALYSSLGTTDDLDMVVGTGQLDTIYLAVTDQFSLWDHYKIKENGEAARRKAAQLLHRNSRVAKSEYGELKVKVWNSNKDLAPQLANAIMDKLSLLYGDMIGYSNKRALESLEGLKKDLQQKLDSINAFLTIALLTPEMAERVNRQIKFLSDQDLKYDKLIAEYRLMVDTEPSALIIAEKARPATAPDRPKRIQVLIVTLLLSLLFGLLATLALERRKRTQS